MVDPDNWPYVIGHTPRELKHVSAFGEEFDLHDSHFDSRFVARCDSHGRSQTTVKYDVN
jgi:hypothetical protein